MTKWEREATVEVQDVLKACSLFLQQKARHQMDDRILMAAEFEPVLLERQAAPLVSLYLCTDRTSPDSQHDRMRFKSLTIKAKDILAREADEQAAHAVWSYLEAIGEDADRRIWRIGKEGLAVFADRDGALIYGLDYPVQDKVAVSDSYQLKPLIGNFQYGSRYYLLALSMDSFELYEGDFHALEAVEIPEGIKTSLDDLFDDFDDASSMSGGSPGGLTGNLHGRESKSETTKKDTEKFFRYVDGAVKGSFTDAHPYPLILMSLPQHQSLYRALSAIPTLLPDGIDKPFDALGREGAREAAEAVVRSMQESTIHDLLEGYDFAESMGRASSDPSTIAHTLFEKRVTVLFLESGQSIPGTYDASSGAIAFADADDQDAGDIGNDFLLETYQQGGNAYVLPDGKMPSRSGVAAFFRY